jgi:hypothetical protein
MKQSVEETNGPIGIRGLKSENRGELFQSSFAVSSTIYKRQESAVFFVSISIER